MPEDTPTIITSKLSGPLTRDGITVDVQIFRLETENLWILEVIDSAGASTVWDDEFETDAAAMDKLKSTISNEGMKAFNLYYTWKDKQG